MSKTIINGIDVSECPLYDKNTGCYHTFNGECVKDSCAVYKWLLEYKRLQEENKRLQMLSCANCGEKYLSPDGAELYEKNVQLQKENEELKENQCCPETCEYIATEIIRYSNVCEVNLKYKQALENIQTYINQECENKQCPQTCANCFMGNILIKINEVLNDRMARL